MVQKMGVGGIGNTTPWRLPCGSWGIQPGFSDARSSRHCGRVRSCLSNCNTYDLILAGVGRLDARPTLTCNADWENFISPAPAPPESQLLPAPNPESKGGKTLLTYMRDVITNFFGNVPRHTHITYIIERVSGRLKNIERSARRAYSPIPW